MISECPCFLLPSFLSPSFLPLAFFCYWTSLNSVSTSTVLLLIDSLTNPCPPQLCPTVGPMLFPQRSSVNFELPTIIAFSKYRSPFMARKMESPSVHLFIHLSIHWTNLFWMLITVFVNCDWGIPMASLCVTLYPRRSSEEGTVVTHR